MRGCEKIQLLGEPSVLKILGSTFMEVIAIYLPGPRSCVECDCVCVQKKDMVASEKKAVCVQTKAVCVLKRRPCVYWKEGRVYWKKGRVYWKEDRVCIEKRDVCTGKKAVCTGKKSVCVRYPFPDHRHFPKGQFCLLAFLSLDRSFVSSMSPTTPRPFSPPKCC